MCIRDSDFIAQRIGKLDGFDIAQGFPLELIRQVGYTAVSYTHLDVYKRQGTVRASV